jgi:hypothetical protein
MGGAGTSATICDGSSQRNWGKHRRTRCITEGSAPYRQALGRPTEDFSESVTCCSTLSVICSSHIAIRHPTHADKILTQNKLVEIKDR